MAKNILVFSDGTGQQGGIKPDQVLSNVYKLFRASRVSGDNKIDPDHQIAYYDPGLGTFNDTGFIKFTFVDKAKSLFGLAFGIGISRNIIDCYEFILKNYQQGDRIYLFGFSRGAYTVRSVAGVLRICGVPTHDADGSSLPTSGPKLRRIASEAVKEIYEYRNDKDGWEYTEQRLARGEGFRKKYGSVAEKIDKERHVFSNVAPYFIGVFDTVAALVLSGWRRVLVFLMMFLTILGVGTVISFATALLAGLSFGVTWYVVSFVTEVAGIGSFYASRWKAPSYDESLDFRVNHARHAMAIDEWRRDFQRVGWGLSNDVAAHKLAERAGDVEWLKQVWFAGDHSDIGGGYPENESRLSDITLQWMVDELNSTEHPAYLNMGWLNIFPDSAGLQHDEVLSGREKYRLPIWKKNMRAIVDGSVLHESVLERFRFASVKNVQVSGPYRPENLRNHSQVSRYYSGDKVKHATSE